MPIRCTKEIHFSAGHRVFGHEGKCHHLHGHNYSVFVTAEAEQLDGVGRVIDFSVLKDRIGGWIETWWDHGCILWTEDHQAAALVSQIIPFKLYLMPMNPTAENMAEYLLREVSPPQLQGTGVRVVSVIVWETPSCYAEAIL